MQGWRQAEPRDALPRSSWWTMFGDRELDALMVRVKLSNQTLRAAEARFRQSRALADQARAALFPALSASASATRSKSISTQPSFALGAVNNYNVALNPSWELDVWGRVRRSVEAGEADWQASAADLEAARLSAHAALAQNYFALRVADATRQVLEDTVAAYERTLELTRNRYAAGVAASVDVVQAEVQWKSAQAQLVDVGVERAQLEHAIALLGGALAQAVFDAGLREAQKDQAIAVYDEDAATYRQTVLTAFQEVEDNLAALRILEEESRLQDEVVQAARHALELTTNQYKAGIVSYLNVISAQTTLLSNERTAASLLGRRLTASVALAKASGGGWSAESLPRR